MTDKIETVLIIGGGGFMGFYLKNEFPSKDYKVITADIKGADVEMDITNYNQVKSVLKKFRPDIISNLSGISFLPDNQRNPKLAYEVNAFGPFKLLKAVWEIGIDPFIQLISSNEVYGKNCFFPSEKRTRLNPISDYGKSKLLMEKFAKDFQRGLGLKIVIVRPFTHSGPGQNEKFIIPNFCKQVIEIKKGIRKPVLFHGDLSTERDITHVQDMAEAYRRLIEMRKIGIFNIGSGKKWSGFEILEMIRKCSGVEFTDKIDPERKRPSDIKCTLCNKVPFEKLTGWKPYYNLKDIIDGCLYHAENLKN